jgi:hypothetical protein
MNKLSGYICARDAFRLDYCLELAARSLLPVLDELILCDSDSTDPTRPWMQAFQREHGDKVRIINWPWPDPKGDPHWWTDWLNFARSYCTHEMQITLDADEVLDDSPDCHAAVREAVAAGEARWCDRLNFWQDEHHLIPDGYCCGKHVARLGSTRFYMPSDEPVARDTALRQAATLDKRLRIFHLGFLREQAAFYRKSAVVQPAFTGGLDPRLIAGEEQGQPLSAIDFDWRERLTPYTGTYPAGVLEWIRRRQPK